MLLQIPHDFFVEKAKDLGFALPSEGEYAIGVMFLPKEPEAAEEIAGIVEETIAAEGFRLPRLARRAGRPLAPRRERSSRASR